MLGHDFFQNSQNKSWRFAIKIAETLYSKRINVKHAIRIVSLCASNLEKEGRFISIVNLIRAFKALPVQEEVLRELHHSMDKSIARNRLDWRLLLFMLNCTCDCKKIPREIVRDAFLYYQGSVIDLEYAASSDFDISDVYKVFQCIIRPEMVNSIDEEFWYHFNKKATKEINFAFKSITKCVKVSPSTLRLILDDMKVFDSKYFEETYFPLPLLQYLNSRRIMTAVIEAVIYRRRRWALKIWDDIVKYRRKVHRALENSFVILQQQCFSVGYHAFLRVTIEDHAAILVQRCFRHHKCRSALLRAFMSNHSAIMIQSAFRRYRVRDYFKIYLNQRQISAIDIQRGFRGHLGRNVRRAREVVDLQARQMQTQRKQEMQLRIKMIASCVVIQRLFRTYQSRRQFEIEVQRKIRIQQIVADIEENVNQHAMETRMYEVQVLNHIQQMQADTRNQEITSRRTNRHMEDIRQLRRRLIASEAESRKLSDQSLKEHRMLQKQQMCRDMWTSKIAKRSLDYRHYCRVCINTPETKDEKRFGRRLKTMVHDRIKDVLNRANERDIKMEIKEAKEIAQEEIIEKMVTQDIHKMHQSMKDELDDILTAHEKEIKQAADHERTRAFAKASRLVVSTIRKWRARRTLNLLCIQSYEKLFDERYLAFYYRNIRTSEVTWKKPKALGNLDIEVKEEWKKWL